MPRRQSFGLPVCLEGKLILTNRWFGKITARKRLNIRGALPLRYLPGSQLWGGLNSYDDPIIGLSSVKKGTVTVTAKSGGKTATIQITVK